MKKITLVGRASLMFLFILCFSLFQNITANTVFAAPTISKVFPEVTFSTNTNTAILNLNNGSNLEAYGESKLIVENSILRKSKRSFVLDSLRNSNYGMQEKNAKRNKEAQALPKIRIKFHSAKGYHRELLVGVSPYCTNGFDIGYDAPLNEYNMEDMFWLIQQDEFVIQGVSNFDKDQILPIGVAIDKEGPISIDLESIENMSEDKMIYLHDILNDTIHDLKIGPYKITMDPGYIVDRFALVFFKEESKVDPSTELIAPTLDLNKPIEEIIDLKYGYRNNEFQILNSEEIRINNLILYSTEGKILEKHTSISNSKETRIQINNYPSGIYIVKLQSDNRTLNKKIIIHN